LHNDAQALSRSASCITRSFSATAHHWRKLSLTTASLTSPGTWPKSAEWRRSTRKPTSIRMFT